MISRFSLLNALRKPEASFARSNISEIVNSLGMVSFDLLVISIVIISISLYQIRI